LEEILQVAVPKNGRVPSVEKVTKRMLQLKCALGLFFQFTSFKEDPFCKNHEKHQEPTLMLGGGRKFCCLFLF